MTTPKKTNIKQVVFIAVIVVLTLLAAMLLIGSGDKTTNDQAEAADSAPAEHDGHAEESEHGHDEAEELELTHAQIANQNIAIETAGMGFIDRTVSLAGRLLINADQQAHISPNFAGRVEAVYVQTGQKVSKGQRLATLLVPELVDLQANIRLMQSRLDLARSDYQREKSLWQQGISAKQDYLLAENQYKQAHIEVNAANARLNAYGASSQGNGRFDLKSPINGVISNKDVVVGEHVQTASQLFLIDRLDQLWLEFVVPAELAAQMTQRFHQQANVRFTTSSEQQQFVAKLMSLTPNADMQTGRLVARAVVNNRDMQLRPNMLVSVSVEQKDKDQQATVMVKRSAVQQLEGKDVVFVVEKNQEGAHFAPHPVTLGAESGDREWIAIVSGITAGESYVADGSFTLKSELEKGEAEHGH